MPRILDTSYAAGVGLVDGVSSVFALVYQNRTGCQWRCLPHDLPAWSAAFQYFTLWRQNGLDQRIQELLRCQVREKARRLVGWWADAHEVSRTQAPLASYVRGGCVRLGVAEGPAGQERLPPAWPHAGLPP